jgi:hypothetical protein
MNIFIFANDPKNHETLGRIAMLRGPYFTPEDARADYQETVDFVKNRYVCSVFWGYGLAKV